MTERRTAGYVVTGEWGAYLLGEERVLWSGDYATLFTSRKAANAAIRRTKTYAARHKYKWNLVDMKVKRLVPTA